uniref:Uncharacterized protein n=1 Tax=Ursus americanus TaxID=9643 RepID=A0A452SHM7_URSAM
MVPKVSTGKEVGGWSEAGGRASLGLFHPNTVEARDRSAGPLGTVSMIHYLRITPSAPCSTCPP